MCVPKKHVYCVYTVFFFDLFDNFLYSGFLNLRAYYQPKTEDTIMWVTKSTKT